MRMSTFEQNSQPRNQSRCNEMKTLQNKNSSQNDTLDKSAVASTTATPASKTHVVVPKDVLALRANLTKMTSLEHIVATNP